MVKTGPRTLFEAAELMQSDETGVTVKFAVEHHRFDRDRIYRHIPEFCERNPFRQYEWSRYKSRHTPVSKDESDERTYVPDTVDPDRVDLSDFDEVAEIATLENVFQNHPSFNEGNKEYQQAMLSLVVSALRVHSVVSREASSPTL